jgi:hypothetical protein
MPPAQTGSAFIACACGRKLFAFDPSAGGPYVLRMANAKKIKRKAVLLGAGLAQAWPLSKFIA